MKYCLVVDDSAVVRKVARRILESLSIRVEEAEDGQLALEICRQDMPDAVFVDANMPNVDGFSFVRDLRRMENGEAPKILFCMTEHDIPSIARAKHAGADQFMMKPFDKDHLITKIQEIGLI
jgi:two-component system chemotaxis response regulator CheY